MADLPLDIAELEEKYEILAKLGEGGMGAVYKVRHRVLGKLRVIKTIRPQLQSDQDLQNRFLREAQVAAGLRHPHIAAVHDCAFTKNGTAYIVMEHIEGQNLRDYQRSGGRLDIEQVVEVGRQALDALGYLHSKNFIHRDISTDNMMISWQDGLPNVTLIDLGLAKSLETSQWQTKTGMVVGKVRYISPEQLNAGAEGVEVDARSDLYSMGVVLYELLTGHFPITGQDDMSMIAGHLYRPPRPFDETDPKAKIPSPLRSVVMRALEKKADFRWPSAREFGQSLADSIHLSPTASLNVPADEQRTLRMSSPTAGITPDLRPRDPNQPTVTMDVRHPAGAQAAPTRLAEPSRETRPLDEQYTLPIDSEAVTAPITTNLPPRPTPAGAAAKKKGWLAAAIFVPLLGIAAALLWPKIEAPNQQANDPQKGNNPAAPSAAFYGEYHAIVIGNDNYSQLPKLDTPINDARTLARLLENKFGFKVTLLLDASYEQIFDTFFDYEQKLTGRDNLLIFFAGHGRLEKNNVAYWMPIDAEPNSTSNWVSTGSQVNQMLKTIQARHVLVVADACYSGAMVAGLDLPPSAGTNLSREEALHELATRGSRMVLTSGEDGPVLDSGGSRHSVFAKAFLDALEKVEEPQEISAIFRQIRPAIESRSKALGLEQEPVLVPIPSAQDQGGELIFVPKTKG